MVFRLPIALAVWMMAVCVVFAAEAGSASTAPVTTAADSATAAQIDAWLAADDSQASADVSGADQGQAGPRAIHGQVSVTVGSGGYRAATVLALVPVGETGTLGVALADERFGGRGGGAERRALDISLAQGSGAPQEPCGLRHTGPQLALDVARGQRCGDGALGAAP